MGVDIMIIPYHSEVVNENKYGLYNMEIKDKFIGFLTPNGHPFETSHQGHNFAPVGIMMSCWVDYREWLEKEEIIKHIKETRDSVSGWKHRDKIFLLDTLNYGINYFECFYELNSSFMNEFMNMGPESSTDYLVQLLNYDKVERLPKTITTSKFNMNEAFFNYLLMDFKIFQVPQVLYSENKGDFDFKFPSDYIQSGNEKHFEEEIKLIKKYVPLNERYKYYK
jgi:hypothetical protein